jgi:intraflagellar transport protein 172
MMTLGQVDSALKVCADKGDWDGCLKAAQKECELYVEPYTMMYAQSLVNAGNVDEAISVLAKYSPNASSSNIAAYIALCQSTVYEVPTYLEIKPSFFAMRQMLFKALRNAEPKTAGVDKLRHFARGVHLMCQFATLMKCGLKELAMKAAIAACRYSDVLPTDFLFWQAGDICESLGKLENAMVFYNRFVDVAEVIKSGDVSTARTVDHEKFEKTDVPKSLCLRKHLSIEEPVLEKVNEWVVERTVSGQTEPQLPEMACKKCHRQIYAATLVCPYCKQDFEFCHITGWPVMNAATCTACGVQANRTDWGQFVSKNGRCPCCDAPQVAGA